MTQKWIPYTSQAQQLNKNMATKFTKELREQFLQLIRDGNFGSVSAQACGINRTTVWRCRKKDATFATDLKKAKGVRVTSLIEAIKKDPSWQSKAWILERTETSRYHLATREIKELSDKIDTLSEIIGKLKDKERITERSVKIDGIVRA